MLPTLVSSKISPTRYRSGKILEIPNSTFLLNGFSDAEIISRLDIIIIDIIDNNFIIAVHYNNLFTIRFNIFILIILTNLLILKFQISNFSH